MQLVILSACKPVRREAGANLELLIPEDEWFDKALDC
jgi:hypothetical protein